jgi:hypothetical protein
MARRPRLRLPLPVALVAALLFAPPCAAQGVRVGIVFGGLGFIGGVVDKLWGNHGVELVVSTFSFHDVSVSAGAKETLGASWLKPAVGVGVTVEHSGGPDGAGTALLARFPIGADWRVASGHYVTTEINIFRGVAIHRPDPTDNSGLTQRLVPFPSFSYRIAPGEL